MRRFIRHPAVLPIRLQVSAERHQGECRNLSAGGLCFAIDQAFEVGAEVDISIPCVKPPYSTHGVVVWCRPADGAYETGIRFESEQEAFSVRMVEQVCQIELYRDEVRRRDGRVLDADQAAAEWIALHASEFPD